MLGDVISSVSCVSGSECQFNLWEGVFIMYGIPILAAAAFVFVVWRKVRARSSLKHS